MLFNLNDGYLEVFVGVGINDWGGVLLLMFDYVNLELLWFYLDELCFVIKMVGKYL